MNCEKAIQILQHNRNVMLGKTKGVRIWGFDEDGDPVEYECDLSRREDDKEVDPL